MTDAVADGRQVRGVVAEPAVALAHHEWDRCAVRAGGLLREDHQCAVALDRDSLLDEFGDDVGEHRVVEGLADRVLAGEQHGEAVVDGAEGLLGFGDDLPPGRDGVGVAGLQRDYPGAGAIGESGVDVELPACGPVQLIQRGYGRGVAGERVVPPGGLRVLVEVLDKHSELSAPVAEVVLPDHLRPQEPEHAGEAVADDRGAQVPDVHLLRDVGCGVVDHRPLPHLWRADSQAVARQPGGHLPPQRCVRHGDVQEAGPGQRDRDVHGRAEGGDQFGGEVGRRGAGPPGQGECRVGLEVGELGPAHHGVRSRQFGAHADDRLRNRVGDLIDQRQHLVVAHRHLLQPSRAIVSVRPLDRRGISAPDRRPGQPPVRGHGINDESRTARASPSPWPGLRAGSGRSCRHLRTAARRGRAAPARCADAARR